MGRGAGLPLIPQILEALSVAEPGHVAAVERASR